MTSHINFAHSSMLELQHILVDVHVQSVNRSIIVVYMYFLIMTEYTNAKLA